MRPARKTLRRPDELIAAGLIPPERRGEIEVVAARYALGLTADVAELIDPANPRDPIARQFVPAAAELDARPDEMADPIGDDAHSPGAGPADTADEMADPLGEAAHSPGAGAVHPDTDSVFLKTVHVCAGYCPF